MRRMCRALQPELRSRLNLEDFRKGSGPRNSVDSGA